MDYKMTPRQTAHVVDIKTELADRCGDVLLLLGINPMAMSTQIDCPISKHERPWPTFRVNPVTNRYYCSVCEPRGGSLADLVMKTGRAPRYKDACMFLRVGLGLLRKPEQIEALYELPDPIAQMMDEIQSSEEITYDELHPDSSEQGAELEALMEGAEEAGRSPYLAKMKIAPLGAMCSHDGNLLVPIKRKSGYLHGVLEITPEGTQTIHNSKNLQGAATVLGRPVRGQMMAFVRDWESQIAIYMISGGQCTIAYHEPTNLPASVQEFIEEGVNEICLFKSDEDDEEAVKQLEILMGDWGVTLRVIDTKSETMSARYLRALSKK